MTYMNAALPTADASTPLAAFTVKDVYLTAGSTARSQNSRAGVQIQFAEGSLSLAWSRGQVDDRPDSLLAEFHDAMKMTLSRQYTYMKDAILKTVVQDDATLRFATQIGDSVVSSAHVCPQSTIPDAVLSESKRHIDYMNDPRLHAMAEHFRMVIREMLAPTAISSERGKSALHTAPLIEALGAK